MKVRHLAAAAMTAALAIAATGCQKEGDKEAAGEAKTLTVWLMKGSAPDTVINAVNEEFKSTHKGVEVKVELQEWKDITTKTTAALASNNAPDVLEVGNSLTAGFADAGGLKDLTDKKADLGGSDWNKGLEESGTVGGKLFGVPYYAGTRQVLYRKDLFEAAGVPAPPKTIDEYIAAGAKLKAKNPAKDFSALACPGKNWYFGVSFVYGFGGTLATESGGTWTGALSSPESIKGIEKYKAMCDSMSKYSKTATEADPPQVNELGTGKSASAYDFGWNVPTVLKDHPELKDKIATFAMPGVTADSALPTFLGGSNLAIAERTKSPNNALDYLKLLTGEKYQTQLFTEAKVIPNTNALIAKAAEDPAIKPAAEAAKKGWFPPNDPNWSEVEASNALQDLFVNVLTGKPIAESAKKADEVITTTLNKK